MPRSDTTFTTTDGVVLRGWFYRPDTAKAAADVQLPCVVMSHGFSAVKEMDLDPFADSFVSNMNLCCLVYDHRGFGSSNTGIGQPRHEVLPEQQIADMQDAITYAQSRADVDADRIAIWGSSYSAGHVLRVGVIDRRVRAVLSQVPCVDGWANYYRLVRPDIAVGMSAAFTAGKQASFCSSAGSSRSNNADRLGRAVGKPPVTMPVIAKDPLKQSALPSPDSFAYFSTWESSPWENEVTLRSIEAMRAYNPAADIHRISPTPLLMTVADNDVVTPTDLTMGAYSRAREPKELHILPGGHFDAYTGANFEKNVNRQIDFLRRNFL